MSDITADQARLDDARLSQSRINLLLKAQVAIPVAVLLTLAMGAAIGAFHGFGIVQLGLPPFIMTLATLTALRGFSHHQRQHDLWPAGDVHRVRAV